MSDSSPKEIETLFIEQSGKDYLQEANPVDIKPRLFVCFEHEIMEFVLSGKQTIGRPYKGQIPDIPVTNKYVSRHHGYFETLKGKVFYTAEETKNGTIFRRRKLDPGETVEIWDGDELIIPASGDEEGVDVMMTCAIVGSRINIWRDLRLSARDALTGLPGRNAFRTWYLMNSSRDEEKKSLFILDIDHFKGINDIYGHSAGDKALKILAERLLLLAGNTGYVCRWGGDEFTGIIHGSISDAKEALDKMGKDLSSVRIDDQFNMTISAGITEINSNNDAKDIDGLVMQADKALYKAKESGRNGVCIAEDM